MIDKVTMCSYDNGTYQITIPSNFTHPLNSMGKNWHKNNTDHFLVGYHPQVVINRYPGPVNPTAAVQVLEIACSLPKILYANNLYELKDHDFRDVCNELASRLRAMGIKIYPREIARMQVKKLEYSKNILTRTIPAQYILQELYRSQPLNNFMDVQRVAYRNDGEELIFYCPGYEIAFYDKHLEMQKELQTNPSILPTPLAQIMQTGQANILRMEIRFHNKQTLEEFIVTRAGLAAHTDLQDVFSQEISKWVLTDRWTNLTETSRLTSPFIFSPSYELWKLKQGTRSKCSTQKLLAKLGLISLTRQHGYTGAKTALKRIGCSNPATYIRQYASRAFKPLSKLDIWTYIDAALKRFTCLDARHWKTFKGHTRSPWYYLKEPLLTVAEAGTWLNVTPWKIHREIKTGRLPAIRVGKKNLRVQRWDVLEYMNERGN